jgi:hypothetical protein
MLLITIRLSFEQAKPSARLKYCSVPTQTFFLPNERVCSLWVRGRAVEGKIDEKTHACGPACVDTVMRDGGKVIMSSWIDNGSPLSRCALFFPTAHVLCLFFLYV